MSAEENKAIARRYLATLDFAVLDELTAPNFVYHNPGNPEVRTHEERKQRIVSALGAAFPDLKLAIEDVIAEGDKVAVRYSISGTNTGEFMGIPPTNKRIELTSLCIFRLADGKVAEMWVENNSLVMLLQLGVVPLPAGHFHIKK
jgi:predicted ester cyclase